MSWLDEISMKYGIPPEEPEEEQAPTERTVKKQATQDSKMTTQQGSKEEKLIRAKLEELRTRLLDLTGRNSLLNYRLSSEKAKTHIRVIDEQPDFIFGQLVGGQKFTFLALPPLDNEPEDEKNKNFQSAYRQAKQLDEVYLKEIEPLADRDDAFDEIAKIERRLKNKVRAQLGLPPLDALKPISNAEWARKHGLEPKYDMPPQNPADMNIGGHRHYDDQIQTLLLPKELENKLQGLKRYINTDINESGVNTFYAAFGFLQWYDKDNSEKPYFAPLVLLQLDPLTEKKLRNGEIVYGVEASGEPPEYNLPLAEKLKNEFKLELPELDEQDTPERYLKKVEQLIKNKPKWQVRRFITLGRFQFARLVMYHDLDPSRWPAGKGINDNAIIQKLITGRGVSSGEGSDDLPIYDIDSDERVEATAPILITDADSSQHSAIVDAMKGKNLVIKGPPGTGKSQTITNLIANAIAKDKKVLFIAEKMAALDVVYSRLKKAGLGDFCLELHSTKSKLKDIRENLKESIDNRKRAQQPAGLDGKIRDLKKIRTYLRSYSTALNYPFGKMDKTIHGILWAEQARRKILHNRPVNIKQIRIKKADSFDASELSNLYGSLKQFEALAKEKNHLKDEDHPWKGIGSTTISSLRIDEIYQAAEESLSHIQRFISELQNFEKEHNWSLGGTFNELNATDESWEKITKLKESKENILFDALPSLSEINSRHLLQHFKRQLDEYRDLLGKAEKVLRDIEQLIPIAEKLKIECDDAHATGINKMSHEELEVHVNELRQTLAQWFEFKDAASLVAAASLGTEHPTIQEIGLLIEAAELLSEIDHDSMLRRTEETLNETNAPIIETALEKQSSLTSQRERLSKVIDLSSSVPDSQIIEAVGELATANPFSYLKPKFYKARKVYQALHIASEKPVYSQSAQNLRELRQYRIDLAAFENDNRYRDIAGKFYEGAKTDFSKIQNVSSWAKKVRQKFVSGNASAQKVKSLLLSGSSADLSHLKEKLGTKSAVKVYQVVKKSAQPEQSVDAYGSYLGQRVANLATLADTLERVAATPKITFHDIKKAVDAHLLKMSALLTEIRDKEESYKSILSSSYKGADTDSDKIGDTLNLVSLIEDLKLPRAEKAACYSPQIFKIADSIYTKMSAITAIGQEALTKLEAFSDAAELDFSIYVSSEDMDAKFEVIRDALKKSVADKRALTVLIQFNEFLTQSKSKPYAALLNAMKVNGSGYSDVADLFEYLVYRSLCDSALESNKILDEQDIKDLNDVREKYRQLDADIISLHSKALTAQISKVKPPEGVNYGKKSDLTEMGLIRHQIDGRPRAIPLRRFMERAGQALQVLKPCFLMSPLSVAQYISPKAIRFDLVVIDEASQMRPEEAMGAIARGGQIVVVGDPEQLPPTSFFQTQLSESDDNYDSEDELTNESILDMSFSTFFPPRELLWHYRSRHQSLIAFSNAQFYNKKLIVFPSPQETSEAFGVYYRYVGGQYKSSCNLSEAKAVVEAAQKFMRDNPNKSLGIATMNSQQRDLIADEMDRLFLEDEFAEAYRQKWDGNLERFFVKNLESVQGDERDAIFVSTVYGPDANGQVMQRFGPINGKYGHRRLNVLFTRAKHSLVVFTSLKPDDIKVNNTSSKGLHAFKGYLEYAATGKLDPGISVQAEVDSDFEQWVKSRLESKGYEVTPQIGVAGYFIDLGIRHPQYPYGYLLGIECDGAAYHSSKSARDRDRIRQQVLEGLGWDIYRIWSTSWFHDPDKEFEKLVNHIEQTLARKKLQNAAQQKKREEDAKKYKEEIAGLFASWDISNDAPTSKTRSQPVAPVPDKDAVEVFDTVTFEFLDTEHGEIMTVTLVDFESNPEKQQVNIHTPFGQALIGGKVNDEVEIELRSGARPAKIVTIQKFRA